MQRVCFLLKVRADMLAEYKLRHQAVWPDMLAALAKHRQTHVKLSAYYALGKKQPPYLDLIPMIRRLLDAFSPERCMWASDAPYQIEGNHGYGPSLALLRERVNLSPGDRDWLLRKCAEQVYFARLP